MGNLRDLKRAMEEEQAWPSVPWWAGLTTLERARAINAEIEGQLASFAEQNRAFESALARMGFAGQKSGRLSADRSS